jgi:secreted trypsin-like serine protease
MRMRTALAGLALATLAGVGLAPAATAATPTSGPDLGVQIIDGEFASNAPWAARLFINGQQFCTATIIAPTWILTAEHCVTGQAPSSLTFRIGSLDQFNGGVLATAVAFTTNAEADIAVVQIDRAVDTTYARLGGAGDVRTSDLVRVYGWGATCTGRPEIECQSQLLKVATVKVNKIDGSDYKGGIAICALRQDGIPAGGDSGGPMFTQSGLQVGVASTSDRRKRTCYASVPQYRDWIFENSGV